MTHWAHKHAHPLSLTHWGHKHAHPLSLPLSLTPPHKEHALCRLDAPVGVHAGVRRDTPSLSSTSSSSPPPQRLPSSASLEGPACNTPPDDDGCSALQQIRRRSRECFSNPARSRGDLPCGYRQHHCIPADDKPHHMESRNNIVRPHVLTSAVSVQLIYVRGAGGPLVWVFYS